MDPHQQSGAPSAGAAGGPAERPGELDVTLDRGVATITLARADRHNAFDESLIAALTTALRTLDADAGVRIVVLAGRGRSFCAGADLAWMQRMAQFSDAQNLADAGALAQMLATLDRLSKPTIARVHAAAMGGGVGLVACCDIAIAAADATFALSEARLGLVPATIGPYVVRAIGARAARRYFLTAERFSAAEAHRLGLVHDIVPAAALDERIAVLVSALRAAGPMAQRAAKELIAAVANRAIDDAMIGDTVQRIATIRASAEGRDGIAAFLERRAPTWAPTPRRGEKG
jgi:methylglutaconyl-CoA hydratase